VPPFRHVRSLSIQQRCVLANDHVGTMPLPRITYRPSVDRAGTPTDSAIGVASL